MATDLQDQLQVSLGEAYILERELGGGGMSRVFLAHESALGRKVVIKVLLPELAAGVSVDRFRREIQLAAQLQHPHIVPLLAAGQSGNLPYFTMPFVTGESLRARLARDGELPVAEAVRILRGVASALAYAHDRGVVHRDIKPDNVLLSHGVAVVTDFGVAKALTASASGSTRFTAVTGLTSMGIALGTPTYMAPEQASADPAMDHRVDIYAFGVVGYELLTGRPPFTARSPQALLGAHVAVLPEPVERYRPALPPALAFLVMRCLEKHPADRPQSAGEIMQALDSLTTPSGGTMPVTAVRTPRRTGGDRDGLRQRWPRASRYAAGVVGLLLLGGAATLVWRSGADSEGPRTGRLVAGPIAGPGPADSAAAAGESAVGETLPPPRAVARAPAPADTEPADTATAARPAEPRARPPAREAPAPRREPVRERIRQPVREPAPAADEALLDRLRAEALAARQQAAAAGVTGTALTAGDSIVAMGESLRRAGRSSEAAIRYSEATGRWEGAPRPARESVAPPAPLQTPARETTAREPVARAPDARPALQQIVTAYARAIESRDVGAIRAAYPGITGAQQRGWEEFFQAARNIRVQLELGEVQTAGDEANASLTGTYDYENSSTHRRVQQPVAFRAAFARENGAWRLRGIH